MKPFRKHTGSVMVLDRPHVDTDQIIPKQFLKRVERDGFGQFLFYDWRFLPDRSPDPEFPLNSPRAREASILVTGKNFGCGSSREHAPWALADFGFRAIIAPSFADIFANNCLKNGLLPIVLDEAVVNRIMKSAGREDSYQLTIDLESQTVSGNDGLAERFEISQFQKICLLEGWDDIGLTLRHEKLISAYEARRPAWLK
jgi:3-isopropylmalate/(R)-2-methylmalate dehydratase small subunit